jgi:SAM-dependent methyltransferase
LTTIEATYEHPDLDKKLTLRFPEKARAAVGQDEEWCEIVDGGERRRIRFHDYHEIYEIPGLYEHIFYDKLECSSPETVRSLLEAAVAEDGFDSRKLRVLDVGAGNGMVGEELAEMGARTLVGVDIIAEAAEAAERDRPHVYDDYHVVDLTVPSEDFRREMRERRFNCLASVAALGFGDIPPLAFAEAYNYVSTPGWVAFNIKEDFLDHRDSTGFSRLIRRMLDEGALEERAQRHYRHRLSLAGEPLHYVAMIAVKRADVPMDWVHDAEAGGRD